jgi:transposase
VQQQDDQATKISFKRTEANEKKRRAIGQYVIRTDRTDLTAEEVSQIHRSLTTVEDSFGSMKSELGLRPNFHHTDEPTAAHIHITVLAYHVACGILKKLQDQGIHYSWRTIREILSTHIRVTTTCNNENDDVIYIRSNTAANAEQSRIYNALGVKHNPLGRRKMKIKDVVRKNEASKK